MRIYLTPSFLEAYGPPDDYLEGILRGARKYPGVPPQFKPHPPFWKICKGLYRFIAIRTTVDGEGIMCLVDYFRYQDRDQRTFEEAMRNGRPVPQAARYHGETGEAVLRDWLVAERAREARDGIRPVPQLPPECHVWLQAARVNTPTSALIVYESSEWVETFVQRRDVSRFWQTYLDLIVGAADDVRRNVAEIPCRIVDLVRCAERDGRAVVYAALPGPALLLLAALPGRCPGDLLEQYRKMMEEMFGASEMTKAPSADELRPHAARCYPEDILVAPEHWLKMEENEEGNLALSPEQESCISRIFSPKGLPIFVGGRAGSGKSLMLHYILADLIYLSERVDRDREGQVLYLTCNEELLERARESVAAILATNSKFAEEKLTESRIAELVRDRMQPFGDFLQSRLPGGDRERFLPGQKIDFARFRSEYEGWNGRPKKLGAEICWHVIRVYLKGYFIDTGAEGGETQFGPEDYEEIGRRDRTVSDEHFREIFTQVWPWYRRLCRERGLWDEQDLVRHLLIDDIPVGEYCAVLLDEAQDLTRLDLQLVLRLSLYTHYDMSRVPNVDWLPFIFAGDPFQTLNPTGFQAASLSGAFHDEVVSVLDPGNRWAIRLNVHEMMNNYRSTREIVALSNLIQLARRCVFDHRELEAQACWFPVQGAPSVIFALGDLVDTEAIRENLGDTILIVPCEEGGEEDYVREDAELSQVFGAIKGRPKNVLSAAAAKGLEFNKVVLYKFGAAFAEEGKDFRALLQGRSDLEDSRRLWAEYFFNKLYVAVSRGMKDVFLLETPKGAEEFWRSMCACRPEMIDLADKTGDWDARSAGEIRVGTDFTIVREDNPRAIAEEFERKGRAARDAKHLDRAAEYFEGLGEAARAKRCRAEALEIRDEFRKAAALFEELGGERNERLAEDCYWRGSCWADFLRLNQDEQDARRALGEFMLEPSAEATRAVIELGRRRDRVTESSLTQWRDVLKRLALALKEGKIDMEKDLLLAGAGLLEERVSIDRKLFLHSIALCLARAGEHQRAKETFERLNDPELLKGPDYLRACAQAIGFPGGLEYLARAKDYRRIIQEWEKVKNAPDIDAGSWLRFVADAYEANLQVWDAFLTLLRVPGAERGRLETLLRESIGGRRQEELIGGVRKMLEAFADDRRFAEAATFMLSIAKVWKSLSRRAHAELCADLLRRMALSDEYYGHEGREFREPLTEAAKLAMDAAVGYVSDVVIGAALERIGYEMEALRFYERLFENKKLGLFAKTRWIATRRRLQPDGRISREVSERMRAWGFQENWEPDRFVRREIVEDPEKVGDDVAESGSVSNEATFGELKIIFQRDRHLVLITDADLYAVRCDFAAKTVTGERVAGVTQSDDSVEFSFDGAGGDQPVQGKLIFGPKRILRLAHGGQSAEFAA